LRYKTDILVIGSGIAGLSFALKASKYARVLIITKKEKAESNTNYAQGGIASVVSPQDSYESHISDTLSCGAGLCHIKAVEQIVTHGPRLINELIQLGVEFSTHKGSLDLGKEGGHTNRRIVHAKDLTGKVIETALLHNVANNKNITILEHHTAVELITEHHLTGHKTGNINCYGAYIFDEQKNLIHIVHSKLTVICSGGIGQVYMHTTNPSIATGDGIAMAYRSGSVIANMEFIQFHPTSLFEHGWERQSHAFLISESIRGAGAELRTKDGRKFMHKYDKRSSLAPRDIVARAIDSEMKKRGDEYVYLDCKRISKKILTSSFPNIYNKCKEIGLNLPKDYIPVVPSAHYICGGIVTDLQGRTTIGNLYALGESAMTGVHGANRLASNSLLEALVFSDYASKDCQLNLKGKKLTSISTKEIPDWDDSGTVNAEEWVIISQSRNEIREIMSKYVGIVRSNYRLKLALKRIINIRSEIKDFYRRTRINRELLELRNIALNSYLVIRCALKRKESRGLHYNTDYPKMNKNFEHDTLITNK
jgi:L-aspartate oxidase